MEKKANNLSKAFGKDLGDALTQVTNLLILGTDSNDFNVPKPKYKATVRAAQWLIVFFQEVAPSNWVEPNVTSGPEGEVVLEWWYNHKNLALYVGEQHIEYVQVWEEGTDAKITDGDIESLDDSRSLWTWLTE